MNDKPLSLATNIDQGQLKRGLQNRHIQLIAIGGAIGTGLFMGSGKAISLAGPSLIIINYRLCFIFRNESHGGTTPFQFKL